MKLYFLSWTKPKYEVSIYYVALCTKQRTITNTCKFSLPFYVVQAAQLHFRATKIQRSLQSQSHKHNVFNRLASIWTSLINSGNSTPLNTKPLSTHERFFCIMSWGFIFCGRVVCHWIGTRGKWKWQSLPDMILNNSWIFCRITYYKKF